MGAVRYFKHGRVYAETVAVADLKVRASLATQGYAVVGDVALRPCLVQPKPDQTWWEWRSEIDTQKDEEVREWPKKPLEGDRRS